MLTSCPPGGLLRIRRTSTRRNAVAVAWEPSQPRMWFWDHSFRDNRTVVQPPDPRCVAAGPRQRRTAGTVRDPRFHPSKDDPLRVTFQSKIAARCGTTRRATLRFVTVGHASDAFWRNVLVHAPEFTAGSWRQTRPMWRDRIKRGDLLPSKAGKSGATPVRVTPPRLPHDSCIGPPLTQRDSRVCPSGQPACVLR